MCDRRPGTREAPAAPAQPADTRYRPATAAERALARDRLARRVAAGSSSRVPLRAFADLLTGIDLHVISADTWPLHLLQTHVDLDRLRVKLGLRDAGPEVRDADIGYAITATVAGTVVLFDGHHALIAQALLGVPIQAWAYTGRSDGPRRIGLPHLP